MTRRVGSPPVWESMTRMADMLWPHIIAAAMAAHKGDDGGAASGAAASSGDGRFQRRFRAFRRGEPVGAHHLAKLRAPGHQGSRGTLHDDASALHQQYFVELLEQMQAVHGREHAGVGKNAEKVRVHL